MGVTKSCEVNILVEALKDLINHIGQKTIHIGDFVVYDNGSGAIEIHISGQKQDPIIYKSQQQIYKELFEQRKHEMHLVDFVDITTDIVNRSSNIYASENTVRVWKEQWIK